MAEDREVRVRGTSSNERPSVGGRRMICGICGDWATGKHYGAYTCYGCKGFFQRTVRKGVLYVCRFSRNCDIMKEKRNKCRYCRFRRCLEAGMRREAVQEEREPRPKDGVNVITNPSPRALTYRAGEAYSISDAIQTPSPSYFVPNSITVAVLLQAETYATHLIKGDMMSQISPVITNSRNPEDIPIAMASEKKEAMRLEIQYAVEWAKYVPGFAELDMDAQICLLKHHSGELLLLEWVRNSLHMDGCILLPSGKRFFIPASIEGTTKTAINRRLIQVIRTCQRLKVQDSEFVCLKALILFDPDAPGIKSEEEKQKVALVQTRVTHLLEASVDKVHQGRTAALMLLLPKLYALSLELRKILKALRNCALKEVPRLVQEVLLGEDEIDPSICWELKGLALSSECKESKSSCIEETQNVDSTSSNHSSPGPAPFTDEMMMGVGGVSSISSNYSTTSNESNNSRNQFMEELGELSPFPVEPVLEECLECFNQAPSPAITVMELDNYLHSH